MLNDIEDPGLEGRDLFLMRIGMRQGYPSEPGASEGYDRGRAPVAPERRSAVARLRQGLERGAVHRGKPDPAVAPGRAPRFLRLGDAQIVPLPSK